MTDLTDLDMHPFAQHVLESGVAVDKALRNRKNLKTVPEDGRELDEHEFFLTRVAFSMAEVLNCCQQLSQIPIFLANHRQTARMTKAGINRHSLIVYHLENYIIRTQSLLDRVLKLIDGVFHLLNAPRNCRYDVVIRNVKIQVSDIAEHIKNLRKLLEKYSGARSEIIHHHSIKEEALHRLDMYYLLERLRHITPNLKPEFGDHIKSTIFEILWFKKSELFAFNKEIAASITIIFDKLAPYYEREEKALRLRLSKPGN